MFELIEGIRSVVKTCMAVKPKERVLVLADNEGGAIWMGEIVMNVIDSVGGEAVMTIIKPPEYGGEPPEVAAAAMKIVDAVVRVTDKAALVHSNARKDASASGVRYYILHPSLEDELKRGVSVKELRIIKERTENIANRLTEASVARVTTPFGTDITMSLKGRKGIALNPLSRTLSSPPDYAEAAVSPVEGTAQGIVVVDLAICQWKYILREPLRCIVDAGKVVEVLGSKQDVDKMRLTVSTDEGASNIAELGIGTSHIIPGAIRGIKRDSARTGTAHIGIGRNNDIGGNTWSFVHVDALMGQVTVELDGCCVLKEGALQI